MASAMTGKSRNLTVANIALVYASTRESQGLKPGVVEVSNVRAEARTYLRDKCKCKDNAGGPSTYRVRMTAKNKQQPKSAIVG